VSALDSLDVLLIDLQDVGARYYTYPSTAVLMMRDAAPRGVRVVILDRPNPVGGTAVQGTMPVPPGELPPSGGFMPVPMRHGMTIGELARFANVELAIGADMVVVPAGGWRRGLYYDAIGLPWVRPSPAMPGLESALHYPGLCLFEGTNLSVGGDDVPFQVVGAPWLEPGRVLQALGIGEGGSGEAEGLDGVEVSATTFTPRDPTDAKYGGVEVRGLRLRVTDRSRYDPTRAAVALLAAIRATHPDSFRFRAGRFDRLAGDERLRGALESGVPPSRIWREWDARVAWFKERRASASEFGTLRPGKRLLCRAERHPSGREDGFVRLIAPSRALIGAGVIPTRSRPWRGDRQADWRSGRVGALGGSCCCSAGCSYPRRSGGAAGANQTLGLRFTLDRVGDRPSFGVAVICAAVPASGCLWRCSRGGAGASMLVSTPRALGGGAGIDAVLRGAGRAPLALGLPALVFGAGPGCTDRVILALATVVTVVQRVVHVARVSGTAQGGSRRRRETVPARIPATGKGAER
jgi:uncharacterized protein YbbC (DUF1343 family)